MRFPKGIPILLALLWLLILPVSAKETQLAVQFTPDGKPAEEVSFRLYQIPPVTDSSPEALRQLAGTLAETLRDTPPDAIACTSTDGRAYFHSLDAGTYLMVGTAYIRDQQSYHPSPTILFWTPGQELTVFAKYTCLPVQTGDPSHPAAAYLAACVSAAFLMILLLWKKCRFSLDLPIKPADST